MLASPVALIADDPELGASLAEHLVGVLDRALVRSSYGDVATLLDRDFDGLLLLTVAGATEVQPVLRLVRDLCLQKFPCSVAVVENGGMPRLELDVLDPYLVRRLRWPTDAAFLVTLVQELGRGRHSV